MSFTISTLAFVAAIALVAVASTRRTAAPPAPTEPIPGVEHGVGTLQVAVDLALFTQWWRPTGEVRAALVIVHGLRDHSSRYAEFAAALARRGVAVHAYDLRGHGRSGGERVYIDAFAEHTGDLARVLLEVQRREPGAPVFLLGHSMGGAIVTTHVREQHPALAGVILSAAALKPGEDVSPWMIRTTRRLARHLPRLRVLRLQPRWFSRDPAVVRENRRTDPWIDRRAIPARTAAELLGALERIVAGMEEVRAPLLILHGSADRITDPAGSADLHRRAGSADKTFTRYPGLYHDLLHEPERERVTRDIGEWMLARIAR